MDNRKKKLPIWVLNYPLHLVIAIQCLSFALYLLTTMPRVLSSTILSNNLFFLISSYVDDRLVSLSITALGIIMIVSIIKNNRAVMKTCLYIASILLSALSVSIIISVFSCTGTHNSFGLIFVPPMMLCVFLASALEGG